MKIETTPLEGVASQDSKMSRAEREHRLWLTGYPRKPNRNARIWTKSEAIAILREINELGILGSSTNRPDTFTTSWLEQRMREDLGFKQFFLIDDPQPGDFL